MNHLHNESTNRETQINCISPEMIEDFLQHVAKKGLSKGTVKKYRCDLVHFYEFLPPEKHLEHDVLVRWLEKLLEDGYSQRTLCSRTSVANHFLASIGRRDLQIDSPPLPKDDIQPELTRSEYLRLLQAAKLLEKERLYLLVKVFGSIGLPIQELDKLTVESLQKGSVTIQFSGSNQILRIPECLKQELFDYAGRENISSGQIFVTRNGKPLNRTNVTEALKQLCRDARVSEEKATPRCLRKLYTATRDDIMAKLELLADQTYERLLETEQLTIGWDN